MPKNRKRPKEWHNHANSHVDRSAHNRLPHVEIEGDVQPAEPVRLHRTHPKKGRPKKGRE